MSTPRPRDTLSRALRDLRTASGLSAAEVAERTGFSRPKVSRYETGRLIPPPDAAESYARAVNATPEDVRRIVALASDVRESAETRLVLLRPGSGGAMRMQDRIRRIEEQSQRVATFSNTILPGLLQTADYMRMVFRSVDLPDGEVDAAISGRLARQTQARRGDRDYVQILTEGVLTWHVGSPALMIEQCERLAELARADGDRFKVGVIRMRTPGDQFPMQAFDYYDDRAVLMGTQAATAFMTQRADVDLFGGLFRRMEAQADFGETAAALFARYAEDYRSSR